MVDVRAVVDALVREQVALAVERDQVADALAGRAIGAVDDRARRLIALRRLDHLDGREHVAIAEPHHALGVVSVEAQRDLLDELPAGRARECGERARDPVALCRRRWREIGHTVAGGGWCGAQRDRQKGADQSAQAVREHGLGVPAATGTSLLLGSCEPEDGDGRPRAEPSLERQMQSSLPTTTKRPLRTTSGRLAGPDVTLSLQQNEASVIHAPDATLGVRPERAYGERW